MQTPIPDPELLPVWLQALVGVLGGGALVRLLSVWLENKRLSRSDYRNTLISRIRELEEENGELHDEIADLREKVGQLEGRLGLLDEPTQ